MRPLLVPGGIVSSTATVQRRHAHLGAEHRFVERDRQIEPHVGAFEREHRMRRDRDGDQSVAGRRPGRRMPWPLSLICWPLARPAGILTSTSLPVGSRTRSRRAVGSLRQRDRDRAGDVGAARRRNPPARTARRRRRAAAPPPPPNISLRMSSKPPPPPPPRQPTAAAPVDALEAFRPEVKVSKLPSCAKPGPPPAPAPKPSKPWKRGLPSASISPRSNALRLSASPRIS